MKILAISMFALLMAFFACKKNKSNTPDGEQLPDVELKTRTVSSGLSHVWEMVYGPDQQLWITERAGKISRVNPQTGAVSLLLNVPDVVSNGEGGLLGMAINPQFSTNPWVYVVYNYNSASGYKEKVVRYTYSGTALTSPLTILDLIPASSIHNGSRLLISNDQKLFISTGDASEAANAQNTASLSGKILRVNMDGSIPVDNPIANNRIWTYGHRNPQGLVQVGAKLYASEHGPNNDDEVNLILKGRNYGWPNVEGFCDKPAEQTFCSANNVVEPLMAWTPTIATSGLTYYNSDLIPQFKNSLLLLSLKASKFTQLKLNEAGDKILGSKDFFVNEFGRLRAICQSPDGKIYIGSSNGSNDKIIEIN
ncbi:PQQ-dependent sugar dehydrogenase [Pedobacter heparinus]|uniref:Quinoprotein glucose dehydrogenase n=1 Tax=Pedobacter heparinus (strain ATCC 13125 / DSM 2366 / CIP 104194 / JCM 7457 / NBRC 12017 / NCIMB 9290 / NRRL B-14731 / HIM 762-3) TaxID=485917 RepID=C6Y1X5_PEDHD|nr:PQQ-dependent sugar dehydrogenase [Pedobacter heparinus]ACU05117.1 Quinoprotein glucose dehydrogenase [Pedobacter heparinus DSM 2366]